MQIIAGEFRGRKIETLKSRDIRPTSGRVREAVFNMLAHGAGLPLIEARVADICCGSGALGLEALSRGAAKVSFVDSSRESLEVARANAKKLGVMDRCDFIRGEAENLPTSHQQFSLVFLDPPYGKNLIMPSLIALMDRGWLAPNALIVAEMAERDALPSLPQFEYFKEREYGKVKIAILRYSR